jgi:endonuclease YncB( thermonuclease family)
MALIYTDGYQFFGEYRAQCLSITDGDTTILYADKGDHDYRVCSYRLFGINTPEMHSDDPEKRKKAQAAKARLSELLRPIMAPALKGPWPLRIITAKNPEKYGRGLATIYTFVGGVEVNVNELLVKEGLAVKYDGGKKDE